MNLNEFRDGPPLLLLPKLVTGLLLAGDEEVVANGGGLGGGGRAVGHGGEVVAPLVYKIAAATVFGAKFKLVLLNMLKAATQVLNAPEAKCLISVFFQSCMCVMNCHSRAAATSAAFL